MTHTQRIRWRLAAAAPAVALIVLSGVGCRGNLGSALAVATGRADIQSLQTTTAQKAALANPAVMTPEGAYPAIRQPNNQPVNQASFDPRGSDASPSARLFPAVDPVTGNPAAAPSRDEAFAAILPTLQRLAETNPAAQQRLLAEIEAADPAHWPLLVRRIEADLGVHRQLNQPDEPSRSVRPASHSGHHHHQQPGGGNGSSTRPTSGSATRSDVFGQQTSAPRQDGLDREGRFPVRQVAYNDSTALVNQASSIDSSSAAGGPFAPPPLQADSRGGVRNPYVDSSAHRSQAPGSATRLPPVRPVEGRAFNRHPSDGRHATDNNPTRPKPMAKLVDNHFATQAGFDRRDSGTQVYDRDASANPKMIDNPMVGPTGGRLAWRDALQQAIADLDQTTPSPPQSAGESYQHARLRLLQLAAGDLDGASTAIPGLSSTEQSYWSHQLFAISKLMDDQTHPETKRRAAAANLHLAKAAAELESLSSLAVRKLTFCDKVYGFGAYDPIDDPTFRPGDKLTLYAEVRNYKSMRVGKGLHAATLATSYRLLNSRGEVIEADDFPLIEDECYSRRRDFHIQFTYPLPEEIKPGDYRLELVLEDRLGKKRGTASIDLWVE